jgi:lipid-binding SYLF domain-containing protein
MSVAVRWTLVVLLSLLVATSAIAETREERRVADATNVLDELLRIPERSIPPALLSSAYAVAVVPNVVKLGFGIGARRGKGILVVRQGDNAWSSPSFITMTGGSIGWQLGAQATDVILVFRTRKSVDRIAEGKFTLGADASVAAGPVGRHTGVATDLRFEAEVVSYSRSRGLFAGVAFEGAGLSMDRRANAAFYGTTSMTPEEIFASSPSIAPDIADGFLQVLTTQARRLPAEPSAVPETQPVSVEQDSPSEVRTFGLPDPDES